VALNMTVPADNQLTLVLVTPGGASVTLVPRYSLAYPGSNLTNTVLEDGAQTPLTYGTAPYTGTFHIATLLDLSFGGVVAAGTWTLQIRYNGSGTAYLNSWSLIIARDVSPQVAAGGAAPGGEAAPAALTPDELAPLAHEAVARWAATGLTAQQL